MAVGAVGAVGALQLLALKLLLRRSTLELRDLLQLLSFGSFQLDTLSSWALDPAHRMLWNAVDAVWMTKTLKFERLFAIVCDYLMNPRAFCWIEMQRKVGASIFPPSTFSRKWSKHYVNASINTLTIKNQPEITFMLA